MSIPTKVSAIRWTRERASLAALACLLAGTAGGWSIRALRGGPAEPAATRATAEAMPAAQQPAASAAQTSAQLKEMADRQAAPLLEKLKADGENADLLASVGNLYYDAQQYPVAVDYYARALRSRPADAAVRTDMGTAFWFMGNADKAISEFEKALTYVPNNSNTLFNLGLVKWKGKQDASGAIAAWEQLLAADPNYAQKSQVEQMLAEVKSHAAAPQVAKAN
jgi:tetratricopeptide (TPR) repeat protein